MLSHGKRVRKRPRTPIQVLRSRQSAKKVKKTLRDHWDRMVDDECIETNTGLTPQMFNVLLREVQDDINCTRKGWRSVNNRHVRMFDHVAIQ